MYFTILSYFKFLLKSTNQHGIHSPFLYEFTTKCLYRRPKKFKSVFHTIRKRLDNNNETITVRDFGAGSNYFKGNQRSISDISKHAGISAKRGQLLYQVIQYFKPRLILEVGTSLGLSTSCMALGNPNAKIITLEGCPETANVAKNQFKNFQLNDIEIVVGDFQHTLPTVLESNQFDFIYFDGNHQKKATIDYFEQALDHVNDQSIFIFDDIHWNKEMEMAWDHIKNHKKVTISIDTYQWGIVFFKKNQANEHFIIRV